MDTDDDQLANANSFGDDHKPTVGSLEAQARALLSQPALTDQRPQHVITEERRSTARMLCDAIERGYRARMNMFPYVDD